MPDTDPQGPANKLEQLARAKFGATLTPCEFKLLRAAPHADGALCGPSFAPGDNDAGKADKEWGAEREIRAEVIRWLSVDEEAKRYIDPKGIMVCGGKITGALDLSSVAVPFPLMLAMCRLTGNFELQNAQLPHLNLQGSWVHRIRADGLHVAGSVLLRNGFRAQDDVRLLGAQIGGDLDCSGGTFADPAGGASNPKRIILNADHIKVGGSIYLRDHFRAEGQVKLLGAHAEANIECNGGTFINPGGMALYADGVIVQGYVFLRNDFRAEGEVVLLGAQVGADVDCDRGAFINPKGTALMADRIDVQGAVFLRNGFNAEGEVRLVGAQIGHELNCLNGTFDKFLVQSATVRGDFWWMGVKNPEHAVLYLRNTSVGSLLDEEKSWPAAGNLDADGFVYGRISTGPSNAKARLRWLDRQAAFAPQPFRQLAKVLGEAGDDHGALKVLHEMERRRRRARAPGPFRRCWGWLLRWSIGYGYFPLRAFGWLLALALAGTALFAFSNRARAIVPTEKESFVTYRCEGSAPAHYPEFSPFVFSVENSLPLVKFGQTDKWQPDPHPEIAVPCAQRSETGMGRQSAWTLLMPWFLRFQVSAGWLLATLFLAGVSGVVRKD